MKSIAAVAVLIAVAGASAIAFAASSQGERAPGRDMVLVPAGPAILGADNRLAMWGPKTYSVEAFHIDRFEVTNADFGAFVSATGRKPALFADDAAFNQPDQPVTGINWQDAVDYCRWAGKRLPREIEWEKAARGISAQVYPWGNAFDAKAAHLSGEAPVSVTSHPRDKSPYGVRGMAGNVSEWVMNRQKVRAGVCGKGHNHHRGSHAGREGKPMDGTHKPAIKQAVADAFSGSKTCAFIKGNSWSGRLHMTRLSNRMWDYTDALAEFVGFRCAKPVR